MIGWMNGWMNRWMMDGWMDEQTDDGQMSKHAADVVVFQRSAATRPSGSSLQNSENPNLSTR